MKKGRVMHIQSRGKSDVYCGPKISHFGQVTSAPTLNTIKIKALSLVHFLLQGLAWAVLGLWTQNHPQEYVSACPGHCTQLIAQNYFSVNRRNSTSAHGLDTINITMPSMENALHLYSYCTM